MVKNYKDLFYPNDVLINKFGITDKNALKIKEEELSFIRMAELPNLEALNTRFGHEFNHEHLKKIHKFLLGDVYSWAGEYKQFSLYKGQEILNGRSVNYAPVEYLEENLNYVFNELKNTKWQTLSPKQQVLKFADLYQYLWQCHPFNEGNTRTTSVFMKQFAQEHNIPIDFKKLFKEPLTLRNSFVLYATGNIDKPMNDLFLSCMIAETNERLIDTKKLPLIVYDVVKGKISKEELINKKFKYDDNTWEIIDLQKTKGQAQAEALIYNCDTQKTYFEKNFAGEVPFKLKLNNETHSFLTQTNKNIQE